MTTENQIKPSIPTIRRLPLYLSVLKCVAQAGHRTISSSFIAKELKLEPIQVRKDLSSTGMTGQPRIGFSVPQLIDVLEDFLGYRNLKDAFIVGAGNLGVALMGYKGFKEYGIKIAVAFDTASDKIGTEVNGIEILHIDRLPNLIGRMHINIGIITVPDSMAQNVADVMVNAGVKAVWNFSSTKLNVPDDVIVERVDLVASLAALSSKLKISLAEKESLKNE